MKSILKLASIYFAAAGTALAVGPVTVTFDDLPSAASDAFAVPAGYAGLQWNNFHYSDPVLNGLAGTGYGHGMVSAPHVAYNYYANPAIVSDGLFNLNSAYLTGAWNDGLQVRVQGFTGSTLTYDHTYTVVSTAPTLINFNYVGIDSVTFSSFGGTPHGYPNGGGTHFVMDNLIVTIPEPSMFVLAGLGAAALLIFGRRK